MDSCGGLAHLKMLSNCDKQSEDAMIFAVATVTWVCDWLIALRAFQHGYRAYHVTGPFL
jgi:hypothetical protein